MLGNTYRHSIRKTGGDYYAVDALGNVTMQPAPWYLPDGPDGWLENRINLMRDVSYDGMIRMFNDEGATYGFVRDAKKILGFIFRTEGKEGKAQLVTDVINAAIDPNGNYEYQLWSVQDIDFSTSSTDEDFHRVSTLEGGPAAWLKANADKEISVPVVFPQAQYLTIDGLLLGQDESLTLSMNGYDGTDSYISAHQFTPTIEPIFARSEIGVNSRGAIIKSDKSTLITSDYYFYIATANTSVRAEMKQIDITVFLSASQIATLASQGYQIVVSIRRVNSGNVKQGDYDFAYTTSQVTYPGGVVTRFSGNSAVDIPVGTGDRLAFFIGLRDAGGDYNDTGAASGFEQDFEVRPMTMRLQYGLSNPPSGTLYAYRGIDLGKELVKRGSKGAYTFESTLLSDASFNRATNMGMKPRNQFFISGDGLRGLGYPGYPIVEKDAAKIKTSIGDFFKHWNAVQGVGLGFDGNVIRMERLEYFYNNNTPFIQLGEVTRPKLESANEILFTGVKLGYAGATSDEVNGKYAFNANQEWTFDAIREPKVLDLTSPYITDPYAIEAARIENKDRESTSDREDNSVYVIDVADAPQNANHFPYRGQIGNTFTGVPQPLLAYNLSFFPILTLYRNPRIRPSIYFFPPNGEIRMLSAERNTDITMQLPGFPVLVNGNNPVYKQHIPASYVQPFLLRFTTLSPATLFALTPTEFYSPSTASYDGVTFKGYVDALSNNPHTYEAFETLILVHPDTDLTPFD